MPLSLQGNCHIGFLNKAIDCFKHKILREGKAEIGKVEIICLYFFDIKRNNFYIITL